MNVSAYPIGLLIFISLVISDAEQLFMRISALCKFSLEKHPFQSLAHFFFLVCKYFLYWAAWAVCMFWRWIPCGSLPLHIFLSILRVVLIVPWGFPFVMQKLLRLIWSHFLICGLFFIFLRGRSTKNLLHSCQIVSYLYLVRPKIRAFVPRRKNRATQ